MKRTFLRLCAQGAMLVAGVLWSAAAAAQATPTIKIDPIFTYRFAPAGGDVNHPCSKGFPQRDTPEEAWADAKGCMDTPLYDLKPHPYTSYINGNVGTYDWGIGDPSVGSRTGWVGLNTKCPEGTYLEWSPKDNRQVEAWCRVEPDVDACSKAGNPTLVGNGRKTEMMVDYAGAGAHPLRLERWYVSPVFGDEAHTGWGHNYDRRLYVKTSSSSNALMAERPGASRVIFTQQGSTWVALPPYKDTVTQQVDAQGVTTGWLYRAWADDSTETYDARGRLMSITERNGWTTTLAYSTDATALSDYIDGSAVARQGLLIGIKNHFGRELRLRYDAKGRLAQLLPPGAAANAGAGLPNSPIRYAYEEASSLATNVKAQSQLTSVTWQDGAVRRYHYENSYYNALTGITDEAGVRYATYAYDYLGRVQRSEHAGGADRLDFTYSGDRWHNTYTTVTDYSGANGAATQRSYTFQRLGNTYVPSGVTAPCPLCGNTQKSTAYDTAGNKIKEVAHDGSVTFLAYDARGRETERATFPSSYQSATTRPALGAATKVISTKWHATFNLPTQVAEPNKTTANTYNAKGLLTGTSWTATTDATGAATFTAAKTGSTYATGWSYSASNLATTIVAKETAAGATVAVETGRWTAAYAANGDLTRVTDVTGGNRIGRATTYDAQGRLLQATTIYGDAMSFVYSPRGFVTSRTEAGKTTTYVQNAIGFTTNVTMPGASVATFEYDPTHRLTGVRLNGVLLAQGAARDGVPRNLALARASQFLERIVMQALPSAHAQAAGSPRLIAPGGATAGSPLPGQPSTHPASVLMAAGNPGDGLDPDQRPGPTPLPLFDPSLIRPLAERITKFCKCDPDGGFSKPKLTATSMIHIVMGGHAGEVYRNQSYFTEPVNQTLVDEIVSRDNSPDPPNATRRVYYVADMGRVVGMSPKGDGTFEPTRAVKLVVHKDNCSNLWRVYNEVITMYPAR